MNKKLNILITGCNGFIGCYLTNHYKNIHNVFSFNKHELDLTNSDEVNSLFRNQYFNLILNCASQGGHRDIEDKPEIIYNNIAMFENLARHDDKFDMMINFGSGAELDRRYNIINGNLNLLIQRIPKDYYGLSKNIIAKKIWDNSSPWSNIFNIRIFNCFASSEKPNRFIRHNIENYINGKPLIIHQNKLMDFFYIEDLIKIINRYIQKLDNSYYSIPNLETNASYKEKYTLLDIANIINNLDEKKSEIKILFNQNNALSYTGEYSLANENLKFIGLENGIKEVYNILKNENSKS